MISIEEFVIELQKSVGLFIPETILVITFLAALILDLIFKKSRNIAGVVAIIGFIVAGIYLLIQPEANESTFAGMLAADPFGKFFKFFVLLSSIVVVFMSFFSDELYRENRKLGEYFVLIIGMTFGMFLLAEASNLIMVYLAIETMSISSYVLAGYTKEIKRAGEASLKYVIYGAVSSGVMIYGISLLYGLTGTLNLHEINLALNQGTLNNYVLVFSGILIIAGIGYKISAVPFHFWTPDVYEGAPVTITAYLSVASKAAGFAVLIRFLKAGFVDSAMGSDQSVWAMASSMDWSYIIAILSVLTMTLGNLVALWQTNMKRLLAYSSIAHAGYMLMGVVVLTDAGVAGVITYFVMYLFMNLGAFFVVLLIANKIGSEEIEDYTGLGYRAPWLCAFMVIFLLSLTGIPPTAGFIGKWVIFAAVIEADMIWLAVVGILNSVVSLYYYVNVFRNMFVRGIELKNEKIEYSPAAYVLLLALTIPTLLFGLWWTPILAWAENSVKMFIGM